jgi:hypothetical protein
LFHRHKKQVVNSKKVKKEANLGSEITKNQSGTIRRMLLKIAWLLPYHYIDAELAKLGNKNNETMK